MESPGLCSVELFELCVKVMPIPQALPQSIGQLPIGKSVMRQMEVSAACNLPEPRIFPQADVFTTGPHRRKRRLLRKCPSAILKTFHDLIEKVDGSPGIERIFTGATG
jgi:hypothetical protein